MKDSDHNQKIDPALVDMKNLCHLFEYTARRYANLPAFLTRKTGEKTFHGPTFSELYENGLDLAAALIDSIKIKPKAHIGLIADNRLEWMLCNYAIQMCGGVTVPRGLDITDFEITYILNHAEIHTCIVENQAIAKRILDQQKDLKKLKHIIIMDQGGGPESDFQKGLKVIALQSLQKSGITARKNVEKQIHQRVATTSRKDLFTLLYTSGTTGSPKGVMLTHQNMLSQIENTPFLLDTKDQLLSILPIWHAFELVVEMLAIYCGAPTAYTNIRNIRDDLAIIKPTFMASAPRLWENIYNGLMKRINNGSAIKRALFHGAVYSSNVFLGSIRKVLGKDLIFVEPTLVKRICNIIIGILNTLLYAFPYALLDLLVFSKIRNALGGRLQHTISGGGALPPHIDKFFIQLGIKVLEGYGLTETSPVISCRTRRNITIGTVGPVIRNTEIQLRKEDGAILYQTNSNIKKYGVSGLVYVRGPQVMQGYYKDPEETKQVLDEQNWFKTDDIGIMAFGDSLKIIGRAKDTIVLSSGENVAPLPIENALLESSYIQQCMLVGQDKKQLGVLIVINLEKFTGGDRRILNEHEETLKIIKEEIQLHVNKNAKFKSFERIVNYSLLNNEFEVGDELTASFKIKRHVISEKYKDLIENLYNK